MSLNSNNSNSYSIISVTLNYRAPLTLFHSSIFKNLHCAQSLFNTLFNSSTANTLSKLSMRQAQDWVWVSLILWLLNLRWIILLIHQLLRENQHDQQQSLEWLPLGQVSDFVTCRLLEELDLIHDTSKDILLIVYEQLESRTSVVFDSYCRNSKLSYIRGIGP